MVINNRRFTHKVTIVSFILAVFVMYIHARKLIPENNVGGDVLPSALYSMFAGMIGNIGVPFFFLMSGYWLFRYDIWKENSLTLRNKLIKKIRSLVIPYLLWNTYAFLFFVIATRIPGISSLINEGKVADISLGNLLKAVFFHYYYIVFWFMQDLIVITALSPLLEKVLKHKMVSHAILLIILLCSIMQYSIPLFQISSLLYFMIGGVLSVYYRDYWENTEYDRKSTLLYILAFVPCAVIRWKSIPVLADLALVISPVLFWKSCDLLNEFKLFDSQPLWFCTQSFFIYAAHDFLVETLSAVFVKVSTNAIWLSICYISTPLITLLILFVVARFLYSKVPAFYNLICGNRS